MPQWRFLWREIRRRIWFRAALISLLAVVLALAGALIAPIIPYELTVSIGGKAVDAILSILASSMLAVTTFSLTAMVAAFSGASQQITPRAVHLLIEDRTAQNALSTFIGAFVFSLVGIVALTTGFYGERGRVILFFGTIAMTVVIVITLLGWIARLVHFGRVEDAVEHIENRTLSAIEDWAPGFDFVGAPSAHDEGFAIKASRTGYIALIDRDKLSELGCKLETRIALAVRPGDFVDPTRPIAYLPEPISNEDADSLRQALTVQSQRNYDLDVRFGLSVLSEISIRALSPAINDSGTAIMALSAGQRLLDGLGRQKADDPKPSLDEKPLSFEECLDELIVPVMRDGAPILEVGIRLQEMLGALARLVPEGKATCWARADEALARAKRSHMAVEDVVRLEAAHRRAFAADRA